MRAQCRDPWRAESGADALMSFDGSASLRVVTAGAYTGPLAAAILAFKNHGRVELASLVARCLAQSITRAPDLLHFEANARLLLVPVPTSSAAWRRRGYDPLDMLMRACFRENRVPAGMAYTKLLAQKYKPPWRKKTQKGLGRSARSRNVNHSMRRRRRPVSAEQKEHFLSCNVILIDDVLTTGATLREAARVLRESGFNVLCAVVIAATSRPESTEVRELTGDLQK